MTPVFADASFYVALLSPRDQHHGDAIRVSGQLRGPIVVTEFVLIETANALATVDARQRAVALWNHLRRDPYVTIVEADADLVARGLDLYAQRADKQWSLTDCISFAVMEQFALCDALTADHHFEQAGFRAMLLE